MPPHRAENKQNTILAYIRQTIETHDYSPTIEEIRSGCGLSTKSLVVYHLKKLQKSGKIEIIPFYPRGIRPLAKSKRN